MLCSKTAPYNQVSHLMETISYMRILERAGKALIVVGVIDIGVMVYCIASGISYSSSFNVFAVAAGIFLLRGSLRAASFVRWFSVFMLSAFAAMAIAWPFLQPFDLSIAQFRLSPGASLLSLAFLAFLCVLLYWLATSLGDPSVLEARAIAGRKQRNMRIPAVAGVSLVVVLVVSMSLLMGGESATKAMQIAEQEIGSGYKFHVSSLSIATSSSGTSVRGVVTAWNSAEIRNVPVAWQER